MIWQETLPSPNYFQYKKKQGLKKMVSVTNSIVAVLVLLGAGLFIVSIAGYGKENAGISSGGAALSNNSANFQKFSAAELPDKCKTPPGYSDADWKQHMGHHPDRYAECLA